MYYIKVDWNSKFQNAVTSRIVGVERTGWFPYKVSTSSLFSETFSCLPKPTRVSLEVKIVRSGDTSLVSKWFSPLD